MRLDIDKLFSVNLECKCDDDEGSDADILIEGKVYFSFLCEDAIIKEGVHETSKVPLVQLLRPYLLSICDGGKQNSNDTSKATLHPFLLCQTKEEPCLAEFRLRLLPSAITRACEYNNNSDTTIMPRRGVLYPGADALDSFQSGRRSNSTTVSPVRGATHGGCGGGASHSSLHTDSTPPAIAVEEDEEDIENIHPGGQSSLAPLSSPFGPFYFDILLERMYNHITEEENLLGRPEGCKEDEDEEISSRKRCSAFPSSHTCNLQEIGSRVLLTCMSTFGQTTSDIYDTNIYKNQQQRSHIFSQLTVRSVRMTLRALFTQEGFLVHLLHGFDKSHTSSSSSKSTCRSTLSPSSTPSSSSSTSSPSSSSLFTDLTILLLAQGSGRRADSIPSSAVALARYYTRCFGATDVWPDLRNSEYLSDPSETLPMWTTLEKIFTIG